VVHVLPPLRRLFNQDHQTLVEATPDRKTWDR
jgi:hypothetical protein